LFFFRWGAAWTWIFGVLLLAMVFWMGNAALKTGGSWDAGSIVMTLFIFVAPFIYDFLANTGIGKNNRNFAILGFILIAIVIYLDQSWGGLGYRGYVIYTGAMFGSIMAYNVWFRIWPNQKKIINGVKNGPPADAEVVRVAGARSRHNTYLSVPLVWAMINAHSTFLDGDCAWLYMLGAVVIGWLFVMWTYKKAATVKGF
ncbi:MAG TPA: urate hydroxylase PuuD, partial [Candidatus Kapabacteria bacterium]|nr:urate hydroxylase PuuD [Candidatus Kapabacteria bacterium]